MAGARRGAVGMDRRALWLLSLSGHERRRPAAPLRRLLPARRSGAGADRARPAHPARRLADRLVRAQQGNPLMLIFYGHPFSSYTWKALIALYEKGLEFDYRVIEPDRPQHIGRKSTRLNSGH